MSGANKVRLPRLILRMSKSQIDVRNKQLLHVENEFRIVYVIYTPQIYSVKNVCKFHPIVNTTF